MLKKILRFIVLVSICALSLTPIAGAHSGRTDASGCHTDTKTGDYHCHNSGSSSSTTTSSNSTSQQTSLFDEDEPDYVTWKNVRKNGEKSTASDAQFLQGELIVNSKRYGTSKIYNWHYEAKPAFSDTPPVESKNPAINCQIFPEHKIQGLKYRDARESSYVPSSTQDSDDTSSDYSSTSSSSSSSSGRSYRLKDLDQSKPVKVKSYTRKDGTEVRAHSRSLPGQGEKD